MRYTILLVAAAAFAQSIDAPRIGTVLGNDGVLRALHGLAGSFTLGSEIASEEEAPAHRVERRESGVFLVDARGGIVDALPDATGPVLALQDAVVYVAGDELVLRRSDRSETRFALAGVTMLRRIGDDYVQADGYALRLSTGHLYVLPQPVPKGRQR